MLYILLCILVAIIIIQLLGWSVSGVLRVAGVIALILVILLALYLPDTGFGEVILGILPFAFVWLIVKIIKEIKTKKKITADETDEESAEDELYEEAKRIVISEGKASASFLQEKLGIGYSRAWRLLEQLEVNNVVGPENWSKPRKVLKTNTDNVEKDKKTRSETLV